MNRNGMSQKTIDSGEAMMGLIHSGHIHMHILSNTSMEHYGEREHKEAMEYDEFIKTKIGFDIMNMNGNRRVL